MRVECVVAGQYTELDCRWDSGCIVLGIVALRDLVVQPGMEATHSRQALHSDLDIADEDVVPRVAYRTYGDPDSCAAVDIGVDNVAAGTELASVVDALKDVL